MADPISVGLAAFSAIKAGVAAGKEIQSLAKDIGSLWDSIDAAKETHNKKKNAPFRTVNEEAMETFIAKKRAEDMENELRQIIIYSRGMSAWQELIRLRVDIKKQRQEANRQRIKEKKALLESIAIAALSVLVVSVIGFFSYLIYRKQTQ